MEPLVSDKEPFMFGMPVLAAADAYLTVASGLKYEGPYEDLVPRVVYEMREEWGRGSASSEGNDAQLRDHGTPLSVAARPVRPLEYRGLRLGCVDLYFAVPDEGKLRPGLERIAFGLGFVET